MVSKYPIASRRACTGRLLAGTSFEPQRHVNFIRLDSHLGKYGSERGPNSVTHTSLQHTIYYRWLLLQFAHGNGPHSGFASAQHVDGALRHQRWVRRIRMGSLPRVCYNNVTTTKNKKEISITGCQPFLRKKASRTSSSQLHWKLVQSIWAFIRHHLHHSDSIPEHSRHIISQGFFVSYFSFGISFIASERLIFGNSHITITASSVAWVILSIISWLEPGRAFFHFICFGSHLQQGRSLRYRRPDFLIPKIIRGIRSNAHHMPGRDRRADIIGYRMFGFCFVPLFSFGLYGIKRLSLDDTPHSATWERNNLHPVSTLASSSTTKHFRPCYE